MPTDLDPLRHNGVDAGSRGVHGLLHGRSLHPDSTAAGVQTIDPVLWRHIEVEDHERHPLGDADIDVCVGGRRSECRDVVKQIDAEESAGPGRDHSDQLLGAGAGSIALPRTPIPPALETAVTSGG